MTAASYSGDKIKGWSPTDSVGLDPSADVRPGTDKLSLGPENGVGVAGPFRWGEYIAFPEADLVEYVAEFPYWCSDGKMYSVWFWGQEGSHGAATATPIPVPLPRLSISRGVGRTGELALNDDAEVGDEG